MSDIHAVEQAGGGNHDGPGRSERQADDVGPGQEQLGRAIRVDTHDALAAAERRRHVETALGIERQPLRTAKPAVENLRRPGRRDAVHRIEAGRGRPGHVQIAARPKRQVIGGDGRLQRGEDVDLALRADLENRAAAVADVQILLRRRKRCRWRRPCLRRGPKGCRRPRPCRRCRRTGWRRTAILPDRRPGRVAFIRSEMKGLTSPRGIDLVDGHRRLLAARAAERGDRRCPARPPPGWPRDADCRRSGPRSGRARKPRTCRRSRSSASPRRRHRAPARSRTNPSR